MDGGRASYLRLTSMCSSRDIERLFPLFPFFCSFSFFFVLYTGCEGVAIVNRTIYFGFRLPPYVLSDTKRILRITRLTSAAYVVRLRIADL